MKFIFLLLSSFILESQDCLPYFEYSDEFFCKGQTKTIDLRYRICSIYYDPNIAIADSLYFFLQEHQELKIEIAAYSNCRGSEEYNLRLTERKAKQLKFYLIQKGIAENRLLAKGYGEFLFKDCQDCNDCKNEKVEIANGLIEVKIL